MPQHREGKFGKVQTIKNDRFCSKYCLRMLKWNLFQMTNFHRKILISGRSRFGTNKFGPESGFRHLMLTSAPRSVKMLNSSTCNLVPNLVYPILESK